MNRMLGTAIAALFMTLAGCEECRSIGECDDGFICSAEHRCVLSRLGTGDTSSDHTSDGNPFGIAGCEAGLPTFDGSDVFFRGTYEDNATESEMCAASAVGLVGNDRGGAWGIGCNLVADKVFVRSRDRAIVYLDDTTKRPRVFRSDEREQVDGTNACNNVTASGDDETANDTPIATAGCGTDELDTFLLAPDTQQILYTCALRPDRLLNEDGNVVHTIGAGQRAVAAGTGGRLLLVGNGIIHVGPAGAQRVADSDFGENGAVFTFQTARANGRGFEALFATTTSAGGTTYTLFHIEERNFIAHASRIGSFPAQPAGLEVITRTFKLDSNFNAYAVGREGPGSSSQRIFKFVLGESLGQVVYDETTDPTLRLDERAFLITGP
jgi:hypothetical protein